MSSWTLCFTMKAFRDGRRIRGTSAAWRFSPIYCTELEIWLLGLDTVSIPPPKFSPFSIFLLNLFPKLIFEQRGLNNNN